MIHVFNVTIGKLFPAPNTIHEILGHDNDGTVTVLNGFIYVSFDGSTWLEMISVDADFECRSIVLMQSFKNSLFCIVFICINFVT